MSNTQEFTTVRPPSSVTGTLSSATQTNLTEEEKMEYLEYLDAKKWPYICPVIVYLILLMIIGVIGNTVVLIVYTKRFKPSTTRLFILTLGIFDLLTSWLSIPGVIMELRYDYTFFFPGLCRIFRASRMYFVLVSMFTLCIVAVDRFRKVCRPLQPQYTIRSAKFAILAANVVAIAFTVLGAVVGGRRRVKTDREGIVGSNCSYDEQYIGKPITKVYSVLWFLTVLLCVTLLIVLYTLIGIKVWRHRRFRVYQTKPAASSSDSQNATSSTEMQAIAISSPDKYKVVESEASSDMSSGTENVKITGITYSKNGIAEAASTEKIMTKSDNKHNSVAARLSKAKQSPKDKSKSAGGPKKRSTSKTTFTFYIITVVFITSWVPFLILVALNMFAQKWLLKSLVGYTFTIYKMFFHSYHVNSVVNCYIYGFCNPKFREECKQFFLSLKSKK